tara:strand:+ start:1958 stop:2380 length:423 start_codon:yes stop_codon:yes gene_type:complete
MRKVWMLAVLGVACAGASDMRQEGQGEGAGDSRGVVLIRDAQTLFGTAAYCSSPATIDLAKAEAATPEGREIAVANVARGSARYRLLRSAMHIRLVAVCSQVARRDGFDLVVRDGDIADARGLAVGDLTAGVERIVRRSQ